MFQDLVYNLRHSIVEGYSTIRRRMAFGRKSQAEFLRTISKPLKVGRPPLEVAKHLVKFGTEPQKIIARDMITALSMGKGVVSALEGWYSEVTLSALRAAEQAGPNTLIEAVSYLSEHMLKSNQAKAMIFAKWIYPGIFIGITTAMILFLNGLLVPTILAMSPGDPPDNVLRYMSVVAFYKNWLAVVAAVLTAGFFAMRWWFANHVGPIRDTVDHIKLFSGYRLGIGASVVSTFALLKRFDMKPFHIIRLLEETGSPYQQSHVFNMKEALRGAGDEKEGASKSIVNALDIGLLDDEYLSLLRLYAEADDKYVVEALDEAADDIQGRILVRLGRLGLAVTGVLWVWVGFNLITIVSLLMGMQV